MTVAKHVKKPNFFIIGAPKCGTTALSEYLRSHPDIYMSYPKEPHFFNEDFSDAFRVVTDYEEYLKLCFYNSSQYKAVGEASGWYLYSKVAVKNILNMQPDAKFIVMLRNPVEMAPALHSTFYRNMVDETVENFEEAWHLQENRKNGFNIPPDCRDPQILQYRDACRTGILLERLFARVDRNRVLVILFDDFKRDTLGVYKETLAFLNVKYDGRTNFPVINQNQSYKNKWLANWLSRIMSKKTKLLLIKRKLGIPPGVSILKFLRNSNRKKVNRPELSHAFKQELYNEFHDDVSLLEKLLNRDLSHWKHENNSSFHK